MKTANELKIFGMGGNANLQTGLWGRFEGSEDWFRVCECPNPIDPHFPIGPEHLSYSREQLRLMFNSAGIAGTVVNIYQVCRNKGAWATKGFSFHLNELRERERQWLSALIGTGFVIKNADETYVVTKGFVMLLVANLLDRTSLASKKEASSCQEAEENVLV